MFKELFENRNTLIFDLNTIVPSLDKIWIESIQDVCKDVELSWIDAEKMYIKGKSIYTTWQFILNSPNVTVKSVPIVNLVNSTYTKFLDKLKKIDDEEGLDTKEGFDEFIEELK